MPKLSTNVLVSDMLKRIKSKLSLQWSGRHRIVDVLSDYTLIIEHLVIRNDVEVHVSRLRLYCDAFLDATEDLVQ
jgi:hypothetical protein